MAGKELEPPLSLSLINGLSIHYMSGCCSRANEWRRHAAMQQQNIIKRYIYKSRSGGLSRPEFSSSDCHFQPTAAAITQLARPAEAGDV